MKLVMRKANYSEKLQALMKRRGDEPDSQLERFRALILDHLTRQEDEEESGGLSNAMQKTLNFAERLAKGGKGLPVGTIREWKGKKYVKVSPGKWRPKYDGETRGAKMAVAAIRRKITAAPDAQTMLQIVLENRDRFSDQNGQPLPFVQELSVYVQKESEARETAAAKKTPAGKEKEIYEKYGVPYEAYEMAIKPFLDGKIPLTTLKYKLGLLRFGLSKNKIGRIANKLDTEMHNKIWGAYEAEEAEKRKKQASAPTGDEKPSDEKFKPVNRNELEIGDLYVDKYEGKYAVRTVRKDGNDSYKTSIDPMYAMFGGIITFNTPKEADEWIKKHPKKEKRELSEESKDFIRRNINGEVKKNYLYGINEQGEMGRIALTGESLDFYNSIRESKEETSSDFSKIQDKYQNAKALDGDEDEIQVGKEVIAGKWRLVDAETPIASHDETTFHKTPGFPVDENGSTINDRDYGHDKDAQNMVVEIASDYDGRAVSVDNPVIVTKDGIVISGNNRTMSSKIAAKNGTDSGYIEALKRKAKKFGFTAEQIGEFQHPRIVFETAENDGYSTEQFAKFNKSSKKAMSPIEAAVKVSKTIKGETVEHIAEKISDFDTLGELYGDSGAINEIFNTFQQDGIIASVDRPQYIVDGGGITGAGKEFLETVLIGSVVDEKNIRGLNRDGCKNIRQKLVRAITPLIENKSMNGYSITKELNEAIDLSMQVAIHKNFSSVDELVSQGKLFGKDEDPVSVEIARKLEGTQKSFAEFMQTMNGGLKYAAHGEADIFLGGVETREDILSRMLNLKKAIRNVIGFFKGLRFFKGDFVKKAVPVFKDGGAVEYADRWMPESTELSKSLTWSGHKLQGRTKFRGMDISIENKKGSTRSGTDNDGHEWHTLMHFNYGYIRGTVGKDKDHLDCYLGPNPDADTVFIVHQNDPVTGNYDEDKIMLGFNGEEEAKEAYLKQYDRPGFLGSIDEMDIETFQQKAFDPANKGKMIKG